MIMDVEGHALKFKFGLNINFNIYATKSLHGEKIVI